MANNSPTIVAASLSDDQLKKSIDSLVTHVDEAMKKMVQSTNNAVGEMEAKLKSLGNLKIDTGGSNDGGTGRRTQQHEKLTKAVNDASEAVSKETQKLQDLQQSLSGASDREQNFISQKERAANTIAQENELLRRQEQELGQLRSQQQAFVSSEQSQTSAINAHKTAFDNLDAKTKEYLSTQERLLQKGSGITPNERKLIGIDQQTLALIERAKRELDSFNLTLSDGTKYSKDPFSSKFQSLEILKKELDNNIRSFEQWKKETRLTPDDITKIDAVLQKYKEYSRIIDELRNKETKLLKNHDVLKFTDDFGKYFTQKIPLVRADESYQDAYWKLQKALSQTIQTEQQKAQIDAQVAAKEKEIAETKGRIAAATKEQSEAEKNASQAAREKANIQGQVANQEKKVAEAKKQLTTATQQHTEAETKSSRATKEKTMTLDQQASAINTAVQSEKKYTDEVLRQAAAIRSSKEWQEKGHVVVGDVNYYDKERANVSKRDKQLLLSLEEQIVQAQQNEAEAAHRAAQETRNQAQAQQQVQQAATGTARIIESVHEMQRRSANFQKGNASVPTFTVELESAKRLGDKLKELREQYNNMNLGQRFGKEGQAIAQQIRDITRQGQILNNQLNRPTKKEVFGLSEKTLDDIAYKMRQLASYRSGLNATTQTREISSVNDEYNRLKKRMDDVMQKNQQMIASNTALGRSWNYMKNRLAFYFTVGASTSFVKQLIDIRGQYELLDRSIGILIDSAQNGSQIFAELNAMAIKSPFTTMELGAAAKQLVAYDVAAKDVVDTTRRLADMAAAVGIPIERLTYALGQIKAYGYLNARDARMFANAGIPLVKELADYYTELEGRLVSTADVYDRIKKKAIDYSDVMSVVNKMTDEGGKFFDFQEKAADTLKVRIANLTLAWNNMLNEMGKDNQGILTEGLKVTKQIFESWRDINNMVVALGLTYGTIKAAQIAYYLWVMRTEKAVGAWSKIINAIDYAFNAKIANVINSLKTSLVGFFTNPAAMLSVAFTALSVALTKAYLDYRDLQAANEEFNKSVVKNAEENVKSIDKFFGDYKKQLESVGSLNSADQTKLWERVQEEIEKTTKNAEKYIEILNKIPEVSRRIEVGESVLEQSKRIQDELKYMAERGMFNVGGGFANDSAAKDLQQYSDAINELITKYGDLDNAKKEALKVNEITLESGEVIKQYTGEYADFQRAQIEAEKELQNIVSTLDKVNMAEILGTGDMETQLANVRSFAIAWRDAFLATEKGSKISAEGQALLNSYIDKWIEQQARVNHLIKDENTAAVEANRTAWETFFKFLNTEERKRLDVAIKTNQLGSKSVQELWDNAAERMQEKATTSYNLIQQQIADLRNTPDIVINVVYRNNKEKLEKDQEEFEKKYIQPKDWGVLSTDEYLKQEKANREKYGTLMRKQGEDTAEYEKRISDERKSQLELQKKNGDIIEENKNKTDDFSRAVTEQAKKEKQAADDRLKVIKEVEDAGGYDFSTKSERAAANKAAKQAESELAKALKDELSTIDKVRSIYKDLTKEGMSHADAVERATRGWDETVNAINKVMTKNGLQKLELSKFAGIENPRELVNMLQSQLNTLLKRGAKPAEIKELQTKVNTLEVDADKYDLTKITKGLNNELGKLKDEYELAVAIDADPELGNVFADMMGINVESLPHTVKEYADEYSKYLNKYLKGKKSEMQLTGDELRGLTRDDINALQSQVDAGTFNQEWFDAIKKAYDDISGKRKKDLEETEKWKNGLIEKYGNLQDKLTKIYKDSVQNQVNAVKTFGTEDQKSEIVRLQLRLEATDNPAELTEINTEIAKIVKDVTDKNPITLKLVTASDNQTKSDVSKAYWEDFKNSDMYTMTFEDMANNSTRAIELIIDKLNSLKDHVKEDPASMKALIKSLEDAQKELNTRDPFGGIARSLRDMTNASQEAKTAQNALWRAEVDVEQAQQAYDNAEDGTPEERVAAQQRLADAIQKRSAAEVNLTQAENKHKKAQENLKSSLQGVTGQLGDVKSLFDTVSSLFRAGGDNETAEAIDAISQGFSVMTTVIMGVVAAMVLLKSSNPELLAIAAALSVIVGLVSFLSGQDNKRIDAEIKDSELAVKRLENQYKKLQAAVEDAYGTMAYAAEKAAISNKKLQLEEMRRQLHLEQSRESKNRDDDKIESLKGQIIDLEREIQKATDNWINDMLGISSVGDAAENLVASMIDAFRQGEDYMGKFYDSFEEMIENMIMKAIASKVIGEYIETMWDNIKSRAEARSQQESQELENAQREYDEYKNRYDAFKENENTLRAVWGDEYYENLIQELEKNLKDAEAKKNQALKNYEKAIMPTPSDVAGMRADAEGMSGVIKEWFDATMKEWGVAFGDKSGKNLSNLQQGIQGITEDTAGALEGITNGISQQCYLQSDLLTQIRDAVVSMDVDVSLGVMSQILLQLQSSYQIQQSMLLTMENWTNPSGNAVRVELIS